VTNILVKNSFHTIMNTLKFMLIVLRWCPFQLVSMSGFGRTVFMSLFTAVEYNVTRKYPTDWHT